jgi:uncharacterized protein YprB with RNaseH-like and TPR domain
MDQATLRDRLRGIVSPPSERAGRAGTTAGASGFSRTEPNAGRTEAHAGSNDQQPAGTLGGEWRGGCFVVECRVDPNMRHGRTLVGDFAERVNAAADGAALIASGAPPRLPLLFFDLETTGLSGGAGTHAFLVGCGSFDAAGGFVTRQYLLTRFADERPLLAAVSAELGQAGALVTFNGKSFDAPLIETRFLFHRLAWIGARLPHLDVLHPARRFWGSGAGRPGESSCSLASLERQILGVGRMGDVPGFEIPARYFQFVRSGDARPLGVVLEHNRLDLLSLAGLAARLLDVVQAGPDAARNPREALALGGVYARAGDDGRALAAFERAVDMDMGARGPVSGVSSSVGSVRAVRIESLRALAVALRRARRFDEAAACWRRLLDEPSCSPPCAREAYQALAIHNEHRVRDLAAAKDFALRSLAHGPHPAWYEAVQHRVARIERRMERRVGAANGGAMLNLD